MNCPYCGNAEAQVVSKEREVVAPDGVKLHFPEQLMHCASCDNAFYAVEQSRASSRARAGVLHAHQGFLTPDEIVELRKRHGLTQAELEAKLQVGPKTVVRWERGTVYQSRTADLLMRLLDAAPDVLDCLGGGPTVGAPLAGFNAPLTDFEPLNVAGICEFTDAASSWANTQHIGGWLRRGASLTGPIWMQSLEQALLAAPIPAEAGEPPGPESVPDTDTRAAVEYAARFA